MQINSTNSQTFTGIHVQASKMNKVQRALSDKVAGILEYSDDYQKSIDNGVDLYFLPGKSQNSIFIRFIDIFSDNYYRETSPKKILQTVSSKFDNPFAVADDVITKLQQLFNGKFKTPEFNLKKIINSETDVAKLRPEKYDEIFAEAEDLEKVMGQEEATTLLKNQNLKKLSYDSLF